MSKALPDSPYITAVEAACWLGLGEALTCRDIEDKMRAGECVIEKLKAIDQRERSSDQNEKLQAAEATRHRVVEFGGGYGLLVKAHVDDKVTLTGRRRIHEGAGGLSNRESIPKYYLADKVALEPLTNCIGPTATVDYAEFERNLDLPRWEDVMVATAGVRALAATCAGSTSAAESQCQKWLREQMEANVRPSQSKVYYRAEAKKLFGVGLNAFNRAWANAIHGTSRTEWRKPGRKRSKSVA